MKEEQLFVKVKKTHKYSSYQGEVTPAVENIINRDFSANKPYKNGSLVYQSLQFLQVRYICLLFPNRFVNTFLKVFYFSCCPILR